MAILSDVEYAKI